MKKIILLIVIQNFFCFAQSQFQRTIGGTNGDYCTSIIQTSEGYAITGYTESFGTGQNIFLAKLNMTGSIQWFKLVPGILDYASQVIQTNDGGYAIVGRGNTFGAGYFDVYLIKLDSSGTIQWHCIAGVTQFFDGGYSVIQTQDGGYALTGTSYSSGLFNIYVIKFNSNGVFQWNRTFRLTGNAYGHRIIQASNGGLVIAGDYLIKTDPQGVLIWSKSVGMAAQSVVQTIDGGFAITGYQSQELNITKLDSSGNFVWGRNIGGPAVDFPFSLIQTSDGGYAAAGITFSFGAGGRDIYVIKLSSNGTLQWTRTIGGAVDDWGQSIIQTSDHGYAVAGYTASFGAGNNDIFIVKLDSNGNTCGNSTTPSNQSYSGGSSIPVTLTINNPTPVVTSPSSSTIIPTEIFTTLCIITGVKEINLQEPVGFNLSQNYPNPFNPKTIIKFSISPMTSKGEQEVKLLIYNSVGQEIETLVNAQLNPGKYEVEWNSSDHPSGVYFYTLTAGDYMETRKMILMK